jgi:AraC family transcriptional regulator, regulatory protein of adaptative response / DNA-3-methyladenine glycosylase II
VKWDFEWCYRAVDSRDSRFDGWFYTAVTSTGIYCRPSCPARTPQRRHVRFYPSSAAAQNAGFRACRRCRPDAVPGSPLWDIRADVTGRAMRLISDGVVDRDGVGGLARRLGYTERHLHRLLTAEVGAGPLALARAQRAQAARTLVENTDLPLAEVAFAAGFGSVRQFNDTVRLAYGVPPSVLRRARGSRPTGREVLTLRLAYRAPLHADSLLDFLGARTVAGLDERVGDTYRCALRLPHGTATAALTPRAGHVAVQLRIADVRDLAPAVARCRWLLDLDADPVAVDTALAADPALAPEVAREPGIRVPRVVDGFEAAVRAVVGQQISVAGARTVLAALAATATPPPHTPVDHELKVMIDHELHPESHDQPERGRQGRRDCGKQPHGHLRPFPDPSTVLALPDHAFPMPGRRRETIRALAAAVASGDLDLSVGTDRAGVAARLRTLPGIGHWTADYLAMRAFGHPDVFLPSDLGAGRGARALGLPATPGTLAAHAQQQWAPWRSYALMRLWRRA